MWRPRELVRHAESTTRGAQVAERTAAWGGFCSPCPYVTAWAAWCWQVKQIKRRGQCEKKTSRYKLLSCRVLPTGHAEKQWVSSFCPSDCPLFGVIMPIRTPDEQKSLNKVICRVKLMKRATASSGWSQSVRWSFHLQLWWTVNKYKCKVLAQPCYFLPLLYTSEGNIVLLALLNCQLYSIHFEYKHMKNYEERCSAIQETIKKVYKTEKWLKDLTN